MMDNEQFTTISKKLDILIGLLTMNLTKDKTLQQQVELLNSLGLKPSQIATSLGKSQGNISKNLDRIKKKNKKEKKIE